MSDDIVRELNQDDIVRALNRTVDFLAAVESEKFAKLSKAEQQQRRDAIDRIASHLGSVAQPDKADGISDWAGILFGVAISESQHNIPWFRKSGTVRATKLLSALVLLMKETKRQIDALPREAMEALYAIVNSNDERSSAIASNEVQLSLSDELRLDGNLFDVLQRTPICPIEAARADPLAVREARRIVHVRELSATVLPRVIWAAEEAVQQLSQNPTNAGRPPGTQKARLSEHAEEAYEELSGQPANRTTNDRHIPTFVEFLDGLLPLLGVHSEYVRKTPEGKTERGRGGKSQTKKLRKGRSGSKKGR